MDNNIENIVPELTEPGTEADTVADTEADTVADTEADTVADTEADTVTDTEADTVADTEADSVTDTEADSDKDSAITFSVTMTVQTMYAYLMRHTYTSPMGVVGAVAGIVLLVGFFFRPDSPIYLVGGIFVLAYLPFVLYTTAKKQIKHNPAFQKPLTYTLTEDDLTISQDEQTRTVEWGTIVRSVFTKTMIIVYTSKTNAWIFPRESLGELEQKVEDLVKRKTC